MEETILKETKKIKSNSLSVTKRTGESEQFDAEKINKVLLWATEGVSSVSASDVAMNAHIQFYPGIKTSEIHKVLIQSAVDLTTETSPNYQYVASNLLNYYLRKEVFSVKDEDCMPDLYDVTKKNADLGFYNPTIMEKYTLEEFSTFSSHMKHNRDFDFSYAGLQQLLDKYLVKDRITNKTFETPQYAYMLIAMTVYADSNDVNRIDNVKELYDFLSLQKISLSTPVLSGIRTNTQQYSSCTLIENNDSLDSIFLTDYAIGQYVAKKAGIGVNSGSIRSLGSKVRNGEIVHTGVIPFFKKFQSTIGSCSQGGLRKGSLTLYFPWWHMEIEDVIVLKNEAGTEMNRVRHIDYNIQFSRLFYQRFLKNENISLFSPHDVPGLYDAFGFNEAFDELYEKYEKNRKIPRKVISARELMNSFAQERINTGRMYVMNIDHTNTNSPFSEKISMSNLCVETCLVTKPLTSIHDIEKNVDTEHLSEGEIALCVLAGYNLGKIKNNEELFQCSKYIVDILDLVVDRQEYLMNAASKMLKRRSLGIGVTNFAYWMAKNDFKYSDNSSLNKVDELFENIQYSLLKYSNDLAKENGPCEWFYKTSYSKGILPIDRYNKKVDELVKRDSYCNDWESLRSDIKQYGLRHSTLTLQFPAESSSVVQSSTNGIEPIKSLIIVKNNTKLVSPEISRLKNKYELAFNMPDNKGYMNICAVMQKWLDQSISANNYYNPDKNGLISISEVIGDILYAYKYGLKTLYYANTNKTKNVEIQNTDSCESGACSL